MPEIQFPNDSTMPGSSSYYVIRFANKGIQDELATLFLWKHELLKLNRISDPGIARIKLQWWLEQVSLPLESPSSHPLASRLSRLYHHSAEAAQAMQIMVAETDKLLLRQPPESVNALWQACLDNGGQFAILLQIVSGQHGNRLDLFQGAWISLIERLQTLGQDTRQGIRLIPLDLLKRFNLDQDQLLLETRQDDVSKMLQAMLDEMSRISDISNKNYPAKTPLGKYFRLRQKLLALLARENLQVMHQRIDLTPIRKLWLAW